jgi:phosphomannomutase
VKDHHADLGFAQDMDADRLAIVSEQGVPVGEDYTLVLAAMFVLERELGPVVANLSTTSALGDVAKSFGAPIFLSKIGEVNVTEEMQKQRAVIGGEGNGGVIYPRINFARDSLVGMALVLHLLAEKQRTVSALLSELPSYAIIKEKLACPSHKLPAVVKMIREEFAGYPIDSRDGIKVTLPGGWFLVRGSNTEPVIRVVAETRTEEESREIIGKVRAKVESCISA